MSIKEKKQQYVNAQGAYAAYTNMLSKLVRGRHTVNPPKDICDALIVARNEYIAAYMFTAAELVDSFVPEADAFKFMGRCLYVRVSGVWVVYRSTGTDGGMYSCLDWIDIEQLLTHEELGLFHSVGVSVEKVFRRTPATFVYGKVLA